MSLKSSAAKGGFWYAGLTSFSQAISWIATIAVANLLSPEDYGLMTMAGFLTAYIEYLSDMGIGAALIQKEHNSQNDLSSLFWLSVFIGLFCGVLALGLAYPTALIFHEKRIIPVTSLIAILFVIGSAGSIPSGLLRRDFKLKHIGMANMIATIVTCLCQVIMASKGFGVYTLIVGVILLRTIRTILIFIFSKWLPAFHYSFHDTRAYLRFGLNTAGGAAISRLCSSLNSFVVGKKFKAFLLGNYGYAEDLAGLPLNKIWPMFQQVAFPLLSRLQNDPPERDKTFLDYLKYCSYLTFPLFIVGAIFSKELILGLLGQKWVQIYPLFSVFCIVKLLDMLCEFGNLLFLTTGKTNTILRYNVYRLIITPSTLFIAALYGYKYLLVPWATVYPLFCVIWIIYTLKKYKIKIGHYISNLYRPLLVSAVFMANYFIVKSGLVYFRGVFPNERLFVIVILSVAGLLSLLFVILFDKKTVNALLKLKSSESK